MTWNQGMCAEELAVSEGLWLRCYDGTESHVTGGALIVPLGLAPGPRAVAMAEALAAWMAVRAVAA